MGLLCQDAPLEESFASGGNIAQVLRQARASLQDPSRPFTPTERRLRSTKSLFGEAGFRPNKTDNRTASAISNNTTGLSRNILVPDHVERPTKQAGKGFGNGRGQRRKLMRGSRSHREPEVFAPEGSFFRPPASWDLTCGTGRITRQREEHSTKDVVHHGRSDQPACPHIPSSPPMRSPDLGILYLDEGCPRGSKSRSIVKQWSNTNSTNTKRRRKRNTSTDSTSSSISLGSINKKNDKTTLVVGGAIKNVPPDKESREYEGLYGSDNDVDTTAWDLGSVCSCFSDDSGVEDVFPSLAGPSCVSTRDGGHDRLDLEFILDAIENEVDLGGESFGFNGNDDDNDDFATGSKLGGLHSNATASDDSSSDASPDPGALEAQRDRNARLAGLLQMLSRHLDPAARKTTSSSGVFAVGKVHRYPGARRSHRNPDDPERTEDINNNKESSTFCTVRAFEVLVEVMDRPRGPADASPPSITELPTLLAAQLIVSLGTPSLLSTRATSGTTTRQQQQQQQQRLLMKACRQLFEVSKKAGADEAFFSSGVVPALLGLAEGAASGFDSISGEFFHEGDGGGGAGAGGGGGGRRRRRRELRIRASGQSTDGGDKTLGDTNNHVSSDSDTSRDGITRGTTDNFGGSGEHIGSICDSLTFAVGCLKNISAGEDLRHRLVQEGAIRHLCRLARSIRELCRRNDEFQRQRNTRSSRRVLADNCHEAAHVSKTSLDASNSASTDDIGQGVRRGICRVPLIRRRVSPLLAQAINLLRDLAVGGKDRSERFCAAGAARTLCSILRPFGNHQDVVLNAARALAKLSLQEKTRGEINSDPGHARDLLAALIEQGRTIDGSFGDLVTTDQSSSSSSSSLSGATTGAADAAIPVDPVDRRRRWEKQEKCVAACVRIAFALGNLTSGSDENRGLIGILHGGAESLPALLQTSARAHLAAWNCLCGAQTNPFASADWSTEGVGDGAWGGGSRDSFLGECWARNTLRRACDGLEEMLVKTVRLLANISINREVGQLVCRQPGLVALEPLVGKCLELFALFEDGALPQANARVQPGGRCRSRNGGRHGAAGPGEQVTMPGEELLLNTVSLVTNLSFYGPSANSPAASLGRASPKTSVKVEVRDSSDAVSCKSGTEYLASAPAAGPPQMSFLFSLASRARRGVDKREELSTCTAVMPTSGSVGHNSCEGKQARGIGDESGEAVGTPLTSTPSQSLPPGTTDAGGRTCDVLCGQLVKVLLYPNAEAVAEAARAFGNFSRDPSCRAAMARRRADDVLVALLGHPCREVVFAAAGALVNLASDPACKVLLSRESVGAGDRLARLVRRAGLADPGLAELACKALHNLLIEPLPAGGVEEVLGGPETYKRLWWTLKELMGACERPEAESPRGGGRSWGAGGVALADRGREGVEPSEVEGFPAAARAIWSALNEGGVNCEA
ncbi:unnamed protein product, partial [Pylaiella littoralis]